MIGADHCGYLAQYGHIVYNDRGHGRVFRLKTEMVFFFKEAFAGSVAVHHGNDDFAVVMVAAALPKGTLK